MSPTIKNIVVHSFQQGPSRVFSNLSPTLWTLRFPDQECLGRKVPLFCRTVLLRGGPKTTFFFLRRALGSSLAESQRFFQRRTSVLKVAVLSFLLLFTLFFYFSRAFFFDFRTGRSLTRTSPPRTLLDEEAGPPAPHSSDPIPNSFPCLMSTDQPLRTGNTLPLCRVFRG